MKSNALFINGCARYHVAGWLEAVVLHKYGPHGSDPGPTPTSMMLATLHWLPISDCIEFIGVATGLWVARSPICIGASREIHPKPLSSWGGWGSIGLRKMH